MTVEKEQIARPPSLAKKDGQTKSKDVRPHYTFLLAFCRCYEISTTDSSSALLQSFPNLGIRI